MKLEFATREEMLDWLRRLGFPSMRQGVTYEIRWSKRGECWTIRQTNKVEVGVL